MVAGQSMKVELLGFPFNYRASSLTQDGAVVHLAGFLHLPLVDDLQALQSVLLVQGVLKAQMQIKQALGTLKGNFSCVIQDQHGQVLACTDKMRSYPLFYSISKGTLYIGGDPYQIQQKVGARIKNTQSILEFKMAGYVTGGDTLFEGVRQLEAGQFLHFDGVQVYIENYYLFYNPQSVELPQEVLIDTLHKTTVSIFEKLIKRLQGRPVWIPLSGGLDSRLVACMLKKLGYDNIQTFSYGVRDICEAKTAQKIAERLNVPWRFFHYTRDFGRRVFYSEDGVQFSRFAHMLSDVPVMMDFYALCGLKWQNRIPSDAVFINGQTGDFISGNHIPAILNQERVPREDFFQSIVRKHYSLWTHLHTENNLAIIRQRIQKTLPMEIKDTMNSDQAMKLYELWEWRARQAHQVIIGQRTYDFFGLSWELPLWDDEYLKFWAQVSFEHKFRQALYRAYLERYDFFGLFRAVFRRHSVPVHMQYLRYLFFIFGPWRSQMQWRLLPYFENYAYNYAFLPYREYIRYARYHRSPLSFRVKYLLEKDYGERLFEA